MDMDEYGMALWGANMDLEEALELVDEITEMAERDDLPSKAIDFAESVSKKAASIGATIESTGAVSDAQSAALENMRDGLARWFRD